MRDGAWETIAEKVFDPDAVYESDTD